MTAVTDHSKIKAKDRQGAKFFTPDMVACPAAGNTTVKGKIAAKLTKSRK